MHLPFFKIILNKFTTSHTPNADICASLIAKELQWNITFQCKLEIKYKLFYTISLWLLAFAEKFQQMCQSGIICEDEEHFTISLNVIIHHHWLLRLLLLGFVSLCESASGPWMTTAGRNVISKTRKTIHGNNVIIITYEINV